MPQLNETIEELDKFLMDRWLSGLWRLPEGVRMPDPKTMVQPYLWKWDEVYGGLCLARDKIGIKGGSVERRTIRLVNPGMEHTEMTSHTLLCSMQLIQPGEIAPTHRHTMAAFRFILQGSGGYTVVDGEKMEMGEGDLILTPQGTWHDHGHEGEAPMVWIDGLDVPLIQSLQVISFEPFPDDKQKIQINKQDASQFGMTRPLPYSREKPVLLHYHWEDTYRSLKVLAEKDPHPYDGVVLEFVNPLTGGPTMPTISCRIQMLNPGERTKVHRHTSTTIYHAFRGSGSTLINGQTFHWDKGDTFIIPLWYWHEHLSRSASGESILFSMTDEPVLKAFGLYREEEQVGFHVDQ